MIRVGVAGWDYPDWAGIVYPSPLPRGFDRLSFLAGFFDAIEINVTFYRQIDPKTSASWVDRTPSDRPFLFTAKLHQVLTHARTSSVSVRRPAESARSRKPARSGERAADDLPGAARAYLEGIRPLSESRRLATVLMQFPHAFHDTA